MYQMTPWVTRLLIANIGIYLVLSGLPSQLGNSIANALVFRPGSVLQTPWTPVTYMFLHAGFGHLFGNMLEIFFIGPRLEHRIGGKGFLALSFVAGQKLPLAYTSDGQQVPEDLHQAQAPQLIDRLLDNLRQHSPAPREAMRACA